MCEHTSNALNTLVLTEEQCFQRSPETSVNEVVKQSKVKQMKYIVVKFHDEQALFVAQSYQYRSSCMIRR